MFLVTIFLCSSTGYADQSKDDWYKCQTASQCALVMGNCGVEWAANKKFVEKTRKAPPRADGPCKKPLEEHSADTMVLCIDAKCVLYPPGIFAGGKSISNDTCEIAPCWGHLGCNYLTCTKSDGSKFTKFAQ